VTKKANFYYCNNLMHRKSGFLALNYIRPRCLSGHDVQMQRDFPVGQKIGGGPCTSRLRHRPWATERHQC